MLKAAALHSLQVGVPICLPGRFELRQLSERGGRNQKKEGSHRESLPAYRAHGGRQTSLIPVPAGAKAHSAVKSYRRAIAEATYLPLQFLKERLVPLLDVGAISVRGEERSEALLRHAWELAFAPIVVPMGASKKYRRAMTSKPQRFAKNRPLCGGTSSYSAA